MNTHQRIESQIEDTGPYATVRSQNWRQITDLSRRAWEVTEKL